MASSLAEKKLAWQPVLWVGITGPQCSIAEQTSRSFRGVKHTAKSRESSVSCRKARRLRSAQPRFQPVIPGAAVSESLLRSSEMAKTVYIQIAKPRQWVMHQQRMGGRAA